MSAQQFQNTVQQWAELEAELRYEISERERMDALEVQAEMRAGLDDEMCEFRDALAEKFPQLKAWPGRTPK